MKILKGLETLWLSKITWQYHRIAEPSHGHLDIGWKWDILSTNLNGKILRRILVGCINTLIYLTTETMLSSVSLVNEIQCIKAACLKSLSKLNLNNKRTKDSVITCKSFTQIFILDCRTVLRHVQNSCFGCYFAYSDKLYWSRWALCTHKDWLKTVKGHWSFVFSLKPQGSGFVLLNFNSDFFFFFPALT